jgi:chromosome segregation ATPase
VTATIAVLAILAAAGLSGCVILYADHQAAQQRWEQEKAQLTTRASELAQRNDGLRASNERLQAEIKERGQAARSLDEISKALTAARAELDAVAARRKGLEAEEAAAAQRLAAASARLAERESEIKALQDKLAESRKALAARDGELKALEQRVRAAEAAVQATLGRRAAADKETAAAEEGVQRARRAMDEARTRLLARQREAEALTGHLRSARDELEKLLEQLEKARQASAQ